MSVVLKEKAVYCFKVTLKHIDDDDYFVVPFQVLAEDIYKAEHFLEEWLSNPKQTGYRYERCDGIVREASNRIIVAEEKG